MAQATTPQSTRWQEIIDIWQDNRWLFVIAGWLLGILTFPFIQQVAGDAAELLKNLVPEAVGIVFTVLILNRLAENRATEQVKKGLILQLGSPDNNATKAAIRALWDSGNLQNGDVQGANLWGASLEKADLGECDLRNVNLWHANLAGTWLWAADLRGAYLGSANLEGAVLESARFGQVKFDEATVLPDGTHWKKGENMERFIDAEHPNFWQGYFSVGENANGKDLSGYNLTGASLINMTLRGANLTHANLENAGLRDVDLTDAYLKHANLAHTRYVEVRLPDSVYWTPDTDMSRYTDPNHPDFWQPDWAKTSQGGENK